MIETVFIREDRSTFRPFRFCRRMGRRGDKMANGLGSFIVKITIILGSFIVTIAIISTACIVVISPIAVVLSNFKSIETATLITSIQVFSLTVGLAGWALRTVLNTRRRISKPLVLHESHPSIETPNASTDHESPRS